MKGICVLLGSAGYQVRKALQLVASILAKVDEASAHIVRCVGALNMTMMHCRDDDDDDDDGDDD